MVAKKRTDNQWNIPTLVAFLDGDGRGDGAYSWNEVDLRKQAYPPWSSRADINYADSMPSEVNPRCEVPHWVPRVGDCWVDSWPSEPVPFAKRPHLQLQGSIHFYRDGNLMMHPNDLRFEYEMPTWLCSIVSFFGINSDIRKRVMKDDCYKPWPQPEGLYTGIFECQFFSKRLKMWRRIFVDDNLDLTKWQGMSARASDQELWYLLLHKAYCKFLDQEGYYGINKEDAWSPRNCYIALTGGVVESYRILHEDKTRAKPVEVFVRIQEALHHGSVVACCTRDAKLVYIATATQRFQAGHSVNAYVHAIRVWLPWVKSRAWMETWMKCSHTIHMMTDDQRTRLQKNQGPNEVWMGLHEFVVYFDNIHLCSVHPELRPDVVSRAGAGCPVNKLTIAGIWTTPERAPEPRIGKIQKNPKYVLSVSHKELYRQSELFPFVFVLEEKYSESRLRAPTLHKMKLDVYKICVVHEEEVYVLLKPGPPTATAASRKTGRWSDYCFSRYWLEAGLQYLVVPRAMSNQEALDREFRLTVFSDRRELQESDLDVQVNDQWSNIFITSHEFQTIMDGDVLDDLSDTTVFAKGCWAEADGNDGGDPSQGSLAKNPQLAITVPPGDGDSQWDAAALSLTLMQSLPVSAPFGPAGKQKAIPIGMRLYRVADSEAKLPMTSDYLREHADCIVAPLRLAGDGGPARLSFGKEAHQVQHKYVLPVGQYCAVFFMGERKRRNTFMVSMSSSRHLEKRCMNFGQCEKSANRRYFGRLSGARWMIDL